MQNVEGYARSGGTDPHASETVTTRLLKSTTEGADRLDKIVVIILESATRGTAQGRLRSPRRATRRGTPDFERQLGSVLAGMFERSRQSSGCLLRNHKLAAAVSGG
jgi:hypothetical protein